jgi:hypothetical protein
MTLEGEDERKFFHQHKINFRLFLVSSFQEADPDPEEDRE